MGPQSRKEREVWLACDSILADGELLSYQAIGEKLIEMGYRRGSNSDIHRYLKTYKQHKASDHNNEAAELKSQLATLEKTHKATLSLLEQRSAPTGINLDAILAAIEHGFSQMSTQPSSDSAERAERYALAMAQKDADHKVLVSKLKTEIAELEKKLAHEKNKLAESERMRQLAYMRLKEMSLSVSSSLYSVDKMGK